MCKINKKSKNKDPDDLCAPEIPQISGPGIKRVRKRERGKRTPRLLYIIIVV